MALVDLVVALTTHARLPRDGEKALVCSGGISCCALWLPRSRRCRS